VPHPSADPDPIIAVQGLRCAYGDRTILKDITFSVDRGEIIALVGGSGSGKSTLLKHLIGLYTPADGSIHIGSIDAVHADGSERRRLLRLFGVMYQSGALFGSMTLLENVRLPLEEFTELPTDAIDAVARTKLSLVGLSAAADALPSAVSGGMQKRAAIARAMALDPSILFLDEPGAGLDPVTSVELDRLILDLRSLLGITFVIVTHELESIFTIADRCVVLDASTRTIAAIDSPAALRDHSPDPWVRAFFRRASPTSPAPSTARQQPKENPG
jgi:phospholipid/cholesterol/gamma-HCH transport system ATP-binding protein